MPTRISVRFSETDAMGICHHSNYFRFFEVARTDWLKDRGEDYRRWAALGINLPLISASAEYKKPMRFDDNFEVVTQVKREGIKIIFYYEIIMLASGGHESSPEGTLIAQGQTVHVPVDTQMRVARLPSELDKLFLEEA